MAIGLLVSIRISVKPPVSSRNRLTELIGGA